MLFLRIPVSGTHTTDIEKYRDAYLYQTFNESFPLLYQLFIVRDSLECLWVVNISGIKVNLQTMHHYHKVNCHRPNPIRVVHPLFMPLLMGPILLLFDISV